jgi:hypothetical protein
MAPLYKALVVTPIELLVISRKGGSIDMVVERHQDDG